MAQYLLYGSISYTTSNNRNTALTQITNVFTNNAASVTAEAVDGLSAGTNTPDASTVTFSYRITDESAAKTILPQITAAYTAAARSNPMGYVSLIKVTN